VHGDAALDVAVHEGDPGDRAAVRALEHPAVLEGPQVLADRDLGDAEHRRKVIDVRASAGRDMLGDARLPLIGEHAPLVARPLAHRRSVASVSIHFKLRLTLASRLD
jgi:hypothetical protein